MKKFLSISAIFFAIFLFILGNPTNAQAQAGTVIKIDPATLSVENNQVSTLTIAVEGVSSLYAFDIIITYDPSVISITSLEKGNFLQPGFEAMKSVDNVQGKAELAYTQLPPSEAVSGNGTLLSIKVKALQAGSTRLEIKDSQLATREGQLIQFTSHFSVLTVQAGATSAGNITNPSDQDIVETTLPNLPTIEATSASFLQPTNSTSTTFDTTNPTQQPVAVVTAQTSRATSSANTNAAAIYFSIGGVLLLLIGFCGGNLVRKLLKRK